MDDVQRGWTGWWAWAASLLLAVPVGRAAGLAWPGAAEGLAALVVMAVAWRTRDSIQRATSTWGSNGSPE